MAPQVEERPRSADLPPAAEMRAPLPPSTYAPPTYPPYPQPYPRTPAPPPPLDALRLEQRWLNWCFALAIVSLAMLIPLLGIALGAAGQFALGFGGFLFLALGLALLLVLVNLALVVGTRPRR
jgi:hypothetical protein